MTLSYIIVGNYISVEFSNQNIMQIMILNITPATNHASAQIMSTSQISLLLRIWCPSQPKTQYNLHIILKVYDIVSISVALTRFNSSKVLFLWLSLLHLQTTTPASFTFNVLTQFDCTRYHSKISLIVTLNKYLRLLLSEIYTGTLNMVNQVEKSLKISDVSY